MSTNKFDALCSEDSDDGETMPNNHNEKSNDLEGECMTPVEVPDSEHKLQSQYCLWFSKRSGQKHHNLNFDKNLQLVGRFGSVEQFWAIYSHVLRPGDLPSHSDYHLFKLGIKPMWEDEANKFGGKWIVRLKKGLASRCWENLVLAIIGEEFHLGDEICGAVVSVRYQEDIISIWNKSASDSAVTLPVRDTFRRVLGLPPGTIMEYKAHNESMKDTYSFRNTNVFVR